MIQNPERDIYFFRPICSVPPFFCPGDMFLQWNCYPIHLTISFHMLKQNSNIILFIKKILYSFWLNNLGICLYTKQDRGNQCLSLGYVFLFWGHYMFGNISVLVTFHFWWRFSFDEILVLVTIQFGWNFSFGEISVLVTFQLWWHVSFGEISVLVKIQFGWHFCFGDISVLVTVSFFLIFQFWWHISFGDISVF